MKVILIVYDSSINNPVLVDRIKRLGPTYNFLGNHWFLLTELGAKEVYRYISYDGFENKSMIVTEINNKLEEGFWGYMDVSLWSWLDATQEENVSPK